MGKVDKKYKVVAIAQVYNELEKGNLERFFKYLKPLVQEIVIYDDASTDGSYEYALTKTAHVLRGSNNNFKNEISHKQQLLNYALGLKADFILWVDADEVISGSAEMLQEDCDYCVHKGLDALTMHEWNLWRSVTHRRIDSFYDDGHFVRLWRVKQGLSFDTSKEGLHQQLFPPQIEKIAKSPQLAMLHYGFANDKNIAYKYFTYKSHGQSGYVMLDRLIDESKLKLVKVDKKHFPDGLWVKEDAPVARSISESFEAIEVYKEQVRRPKYSVVCLIYKSIDWLDFVYQQVLRYTPLHDCEFFFVANNAEPEVLEYMRKNYIPYVEFNDTKRTKEEWHINGVYRAYNYGAQVARGDFVVFINSDMAFGPNWLEGLIGAYNGKNCVASRLVESGKLRTGTYGIERNFGKTIAEYKEDEFQGYAASLKSDEVKSSGLFMPLLINKQHFLQVGGYPEGNITAGSDIFKPVIAKKGEELISGDNILMQRLVTKGIAHETAFDSVVYHFQSGELDEIHPGDRVEKSTSIAIVNDIVTGTVGERVLWDFLIEGLPGAYGVDQRLVGKKNFEKKAKEYIDTTKPETAVIIQNATFIGAVDPNRHTVMFLQDDRRRMQLDSVVQEANLKVAKSVVTNSIQTASSYLEYDFEVIPIGLDEKLFSPKNKGELRKKYNIPLKKQVGIFVGSFSEVKGWSKVVECINHYKDITWICVTKYDETFSAPNAKVFARIDQDQLVELLNVSDFFILGSPVETQCLAALEAALCNVPIVMPLTGIFMDFTQEERDALGVFTNDLKAGVTQVLEKKITPRNVVLGRKLVVTAAIDAWRLYLTQILMQQRAQVFKGNKPLGKITYRKYQLGMILRKKLLKPLIGREYVFPSTMRHGVLRMIYKTLVMIGMEPIIRKIRRSF